MKHFQSYPRAIHRLSAATCRPAQNTFPGPPVPLEGLLRNRACSEHLQAAKLSGSLSSSDPGSVQIMTDPGPEDSFLSSQDGVSKLSDLEFMI